MPCDPCPLESVQSAGNKIDQPAFTNDDRAFRLRRDAAIGRAEAYARGAQWPDYALVLRIAGEMEADAAQTSEGVDAGAAPELNFRVKEETK